MRDTSIRERRCTVASAAALLAALGHVLDIAAGTEGAARAGQDDHLDCRIASQPRQPLQQALHDWRRQRVHPFRPIEGQCGNAVFNRFEQFGQRVHISLHCADITQPISLRAGF
jgi:hypothetical protein